MSAFDEKFVWHVAHALDVSEARARDALDAALVCESVFTDPTYDDGSVITLDSRITAPHLRDILARLSRLQVDALDKRAWEYPALWGIAWESAKRITGLALALNKYGTYRLVPKPSEEGKPTVVACSICETVTARTSGICTGGLLCPTCMVRAAKRAGVECEAVFSSGPFADLDRYLARSADSVAATTDDEVVSGGSAGSPESVAPGTAPTAYLDLEYDCLIYTDEPAPDLVPVWFNAPNPTQEPKPQGGDAQSGPTQRSSETWSPDQASNSAPSPSGEGAEGGET